jgi:hypothetical protein
MTDDKDDGYKLPTSILDSRILNLVLSVYGPYAFGVASLLLIWYFVAAPQLETQAINHQRNQDMVDQIRDTSQSLERTANTLERTSIVLEAIIEQVDNKQ